jgi:TolA-binding protein
VAKKENKFEELLEQPEAIVEGLQEGKLQDFYESNKNIINIVGGGILILIALFFGGKYYLNSQNEEGQDAIFQAIYYFEADSLNKALNGDGNSLGFVDVASDYPFTKAANLANFYAGVCFLKQGKFEEAIDYLKSFSANDLLVQARAYALIGDAYMEQANYEDAVTYYQKASDFNPTKEFTPDYLMKLGLAMELNKSFDEAAKAYDRLLKDFPNSPRVAEAKKFKAMNENLANQN